MYTYIYNICPSKGEYETCQEMYVAQCKGDYLYLLSDTTFNVFTAHTGTT
jgi:hypothetical protein